MQNNDFIFVPQGHIQFCILHFAFCIFELNYISFIDLDGLSQLGKPAGFTTGDKYLP